MEVERPDYYAHQATVHLLLSTIVFSLGLSDSFYFFIYFPIIAILCAISFSTEFFYDIRAFINLVKVLKERKGKACNYFLSVLLEWYY